jgi:hypothetical protein
MGSGVPAKGVEGGGIALDIGGAMELEGNAPALLLAKGLLCVALFSTGLDPPPLLEKRSAT